jgi:hypothetical protein
VIEVEEVVISSNTLSFEDYVFCRRFVLLLVVTNNIGFRPLLRFLLQNKIGVRTLLERMLARLADETPMMLKKYLDEFTRETHEELWDSEQEIIEFFQNEENYAGLLNGTYGANLIQTYKARIWAHAFEELADLAFAETRAIMAERGLNNQTLAMEDIEAFCRARTHNLLGPDRLNTNPHITLQWDIMGWMEDPDQKPLDAFRLEASRSCRFELSRQQYELLEAVYNQFGQSDLGKGKSLNSAFIEHSVAHTGRVATPTQCLHHFTRFR